MAIVQIRFPAATAFEVTQKNPILGRGEPFYELDTGGVKVGNGTDRYLDLPYAGIVLEQGPQGEQGDDGEPGRGVVNILPDPNGLVFQMTDSTEIVTELPQILEATLAAQAAASARDVARGHRDDAQAAQLAAEAARDEAVGIIVDQIPNATTTMPGIVQLAGDLGGTWDAPTVPDLANKITSAQATTIADARATAAIDTWVGAAPAQLDTLLEFAEALGNDPNFAATTTAALAGKSDVGHQHEIGEVNGLTAALDAKSDDGHQHSIADITDLQNAQLDATQIIGATTQGIAVLKAALPMEARLAIGAGTSSLALGTTASTAMAGNRIQKVTTLPTTPVAGVLYCIPKV